MKIKPFSTTGIGSLPHKLTKDAVQLPLTALDIPFWPQLPNVSFLEQMIPQYSEGMPGFRIDGDKERVWVERNEEEIARFYESTAADARIALSKDYARGFHAFVEQIKSRHFDIIKGHITGPLTYTLGLKDQDGKLIYYDEELREISLMLLNAKARWQIDILKQFASEVIIFIDEPILSALGSSTYLGVDTAEALRLLTDCASAIKEAGGIPGIHCCGRADWPMVMNSGIEILNFDFHSLGGTLALYPEETTAYLKRGGYLAWGIVPTSADIVNETEESIIALFHKRMETLSKTIPADLLKTQILLTPSCGTGSRTIEETTKIFQILMGLKEELT
jgi:methionine synthase II (cobalamin-independent)